MIKLEKFQDIYLEDLNWEEYKASLKSNKYIKGNYYIENVSSDYLILRRKGANNLEYSYFYIEIRCVSEVHVEICYKLHKIHSIGPYFFC